MRFLWNILINAVVCLVISTSAYAENFTMEDAKQLTIKAANFIEKVGIETAKPKLHDLNGEFCKGNKGELYVSVINWEGVWLAYPPRPAGVGKSVLNVKDTDGNYLVKEMIEVAKTKGQGWVEYRWLNPKTNKIQRKVAFVKRVSGQNMYVSAGIYK